MLVLGIESTCDETGCAVVREGKEILSNVVSSQIDLHKAYGGVVPELACRRHIDVMLPVLEKALADARVALEEIDLIAVAHSPGLIGALLIGLHAAKGLALATGKPFVGVSHIEAHLYAAIMEQSISFPCLGAVLSGGHTSLFLMQSHEQFSLISHTVDDAIGEAFDKVAKMLGLPYPGGPEIEQLARRGSGKKYPFKAGLVKGKPLDFSFSGLKTSVLYTVAGQNGREKTKKLSEEEICDIAASFQEAAFQDVKKKIELAAIQYVCSDVVFGGGVTNNQRLREIFSESALSPHWPPPGLSLDNAAMIAGLGYHLYKKRGGDPLDLEAKPHF